MTPECPKGPERGARPEGSLRERVAEHFRVTWNYEDMNKSCWNAAGRAIDALRPELEQITFERDAAQQAADLLCDQLKDLRDDVLGDESLLVPEIVSAAGRTVERLTAEVERLTNDFEVSQQHAREWRMRYEEADKTRDEVAAEAVAAERSLDYATERLAVLLEDFGVDRPENLAEALDRVRWALSVTAWLHAESGWNLDKAVRRMRAEKRELRYELSLRGYEIEQWKATFGKDALPHATAIIEERDQLRAEVSRLREQLAAQQQTAATSAIAHKVGIRETGGGYRVDCKTCGDWVLFGDMNSDRAEDWKDQHEADTLRPQLRANSKLEQNLELTSQQAADELSRETQEIYGADPERVPTLEELRSRHRRYTRVEGRPSGSKAAAPQAVETPEVWTESPDDADYTATYETQLVPVTVVEDAASAAGSAATHEDPPVQSPEFQVGDEVRWCWTGKNADGTWFNARLTEKHPHHYPKGWAGEVTDCGTAYTAEYMGEVPLGFKLFMDIPSLTLVSRPSPSLRKEGEDSD